MPAVSSAQRRLFAIAEHHPDQLHSQNKGLAKLSQGTLHDFAATSEKNLPQHVEHMADGGWAKGAFSGNKGGLHRATGTPQSESIPPYRVRKIASSGTPHQKKMAQAAININPRRYYGSQN